MQRILRSACKYTAPQSQINAVWGASAKVGADRKEVGCNRKGNKWGINAKDDPLIEIALHNTHFQTSKGVFGLIHRACLSSCL